MKNLQVEILTDAPRFTRYYRKDDRYHQYPHLINDTTKARKRALDGGAVQFDTLSFLRRDEVWAPPLTYFGDFYCRILRREAQPTEGFLHRVATAIPGALAAWFQFQDCSALSFTYLRFDATVIGLTIPAAAFGMEEGCPFLSEIYKMFADTLSNSTPIRGGKWCEVGYTGLSDVTNRPLPLNEFAVPLTVAETFGLPLDEVRKLAARPREIPPLKCSGRLGGDVYRRLLSEAEACWLVSSKSRRSNTGTGWATPSGLHDAWGRQHDTSATRVGIKCAIRLAAWVREHSLTEFRQRDALRAVDGTFTLEGGVAEALKILQNHNVISPLGRLTTGRQGRPPSPWYAVNPHLRVNLGGS